MEFPTIVNIHVMSNGSILRYGVLLVWLNGCAMISVLETPKTDRSAIGIGSQAKTEEIQLATPGPDPGKRPETNQPHTNLWQQLASEFSWNYPPDPATRRAIEQFKQHPRNLERPAERATPYLWFIADQLRRRKLPAELALLPMIESGYRGKAQSDRGAAGLWQFMPETGRKFGLKQTRWYDGRRDVIASTQAALDYLDQLIHRFNGDWLLALAAYNCGPTKLRKILNKNSATNFWAIRADLPKETRHYVPRLLAAIEIVRDPIRNQINLHPIPNERVFTPLDLGGPIALDHLYNVVGWSQAAFAELNPAFNQSYTDPDGPYEILVPIDLEQRVVNILANIPASQRVPTKAHIVKSGDTLSEISVHYAVAISELKALNKLRGNLIKIGTELLIPVPRQTHHPPAYRRGEFEETEHVVKRGESLWTIGRRYGASSTAIAELNRIAISSTLHPGQILHIHSQRTTAHYAVIHGDSLWRIARKFDVSIEQLQVWNKISRHQVLQPGETLIVSHPSNIENDEL